MKIGVTSDTHSSIEYIQQAYDDLVTKHDIQVFVHLGDDYDDIDTVETAEKIRIIRVPGVFSSYYQNNTIPNRIVEEIDGCKVLFTHSPVSHENDPAGEIPPYKLAEKEKVDIVLYGHTHTPAIEKKNGRWWVNPGHLKKNDKRGHPPTYAIIDISQGTFTISIYDLETGREFLSAEP